MYVFPSQHRVAIGAVDVGDGVQACQQQALLLLACRDVHYIAEEKRPAMPPLEGLRDDVLMVRYVALAGAARVNARSVELLLERPTHERRIDAPCLFHR